MTAVALDQLLADQSRHLRALDPLLPPWTTLPKGDVLTARAGRDEIAGMLLRITHPPGSPSRFWSAAQVSELVPVLGASTRATMDALLTTWRSRLARWAPTRWSLPGSDSACVVQWPSRDAEASRALLDHGLIPLSVLAVRRGVAHSSTAAPGPTTEPGSIDMVIRAAEPADLPDCLYLAMLEQAYSALVGGMIPRPGAAEMKRTLLQSRLGKGEPIWVAEWSGGIVGYIECGYTDPAVDTWAAQRLPAGRWGYINCASVLPTARGYGVGQALAARAHCAFAAARTAGSYLYYNPPNPLSSVFWPRQGYRPLWTIWEARPADALR